MANWNLTVDLKNVWSKENFGSPKEHIAAIVKVLENSNWLAMTSDKEELSYLFSELKDAETYSDFDHWWDRVYDLADYDRVWLGTF